jgi:uncharacterized protein (DUF2062 family)
VRFLQKAFRALIQVDDSPRRTALAFSLGVFLGFSPLLGLHTALGLAAAVLFRLNKIAVLIGVYTNNPWVVVPFYGFATEAPDSGDHRIDHSLRTVIINSVSGLPVCAK